jgi:hypothetical protein
MHVKVSRRLLHVGLLAATAFAATVTPAAADDLELQVFQEVSGIADRPTSVSYSTTGALLLHHFFFRDVNDDQHLDTMEARPTDGKLQVAFSDESRDEQYEYRVGHQRISATGLVRGHIVDEGCTGRCNRDISPPPGDWVFVLTGFKFTYSSGDHHVDEIGILENEGTLTHYYNDQNDDDRYNATIDYMWVPRTRLSSVSSVAGTDGFNGSVRKPVPSGNKVIRGFHLDNLDAGDRHIKRFGVVTRSTEVEIFYGDRNPTLLRWFYELRYAVLR